MNFSFEVKESDLLGRIGTIKAGGKSLETPYMFPVIHPVHQNVASVDMKGMGFDGLMTNSYIIHSRRKQEALEKGIHSLLDFDGVLMTDSGGYQVLEYGGIELGYREVAKFQDEIGSDIAVTLDRPTGYPQSRKKAEETVAYSLKNAESTLKEFSGSGTVWVGPVQGGLYLDLVGKSASSLAQAGFEFLALGSPVQVMENYMFADLARMIIAARKVIPYATPLHLFGAGHPLTMALAVALGCDTFDSAGYIIFARDGRYMSTQGTSNLQNMKFLRCSCQVCSGTSVKELLELPYPERIRRIASHNLHAISEELNTIKESIAEGRLWDLVEERSMAHPRLREAFAQLAKQSKLLTIGTAATKDKGLFVRSSEDLSRPELQIASGRLKGAIKRSARSAVVISEQSVPVRRKQKNPPDTYMIHPVLGPYPSELEFQYPFSQTEGQFGHDPGPDDSKWRLKTLGYTKVTIPKAKSRRSRRGASPSARGASARSR
jgi:7-cyano-7-deazaguanine tRNA-ribosyltransferase